MRTEVQRLKGIQNMLRVAILFLALLLPAAYANAPASPHSPQSNDATEKQQIVQTVNKQNPSWWESFTTDPIAAFTLGLLIVTGALAFYTGRLFSVTNKSLKLAREEFIATHRPEIVIHSVAYPITPITGTGDVKIGAFVLFFNKGSTVAVITDIRAIISRSLFPLQSGMTAMGSQIGIPQIKIKTGGKSGFIVNSDLHLVEEAEIQRHDRPQDGAVFLTGIIRYQDESGIERETGFCRRLDARGIRWIDAKSPEYEYQY